MNTRLVRFDIRLDKDDYVSSLWSAERRAEYLLRPEIAWPFSVDQMVWPSVFYSRILQEPDTPNYGSIDVDPSIDDGNYWLDLAKMMDCYRSNKKPNTQCIPIAIQLFSEQSIEGDSIPYVDRKGIQCALIVGNTIPRELPAGSEFLGFDVADAADISALSNCGYAEEEKRKLPSQWARRLNDFGILRRYEDALEFRDLSDNRIAEHAPFWIYGMHRLLVPTTIA